MTPIPSELVEQQICLNQEFASKTSNNWVAGNLMLSIITSKTIKLVPQI